MNDQQILDDAAYVKFIGTILTLGVVMTLGAKPELAETVVVSSDLCMMRAIDRLARNHAARMRGLI